MLPAVIENFISSLPSGSQTATWIVGVSGGADSLALLHTLRQVVEADRLIVAHVNHGWRPEASQEADFVQATAVAWGISCYIQTIDTTALARQEGLSLEEAGRVARYTFFTQLAQKVDARLVAVAHNADDQAETVLLNLLRGSGLTGLRGMLPQRPLATDPLIQLVRPLLTVSRAAIEQYCQTHQLDPLHDPSNQDTAFLRNRVRHELLPLLQTYNPRIKNRLHDTATIVADELTLLDAQEDIHWQTCWQKGGDGWLQWGRQPFIALPIGWQRRLLRRAVYFLRPDVRDVTFTPIEQARLLIMEGHSGKQSDLPGGLQATVQGDVILIKRTTAVVPIALPQLANNQPVSLPIPSHIALGNGWYLSATPIATPDWTQIQRNQDPWQAFVSVAEPLTLRPRLAGERFQPLGMNGRSTSVKELMINRKIESRLRPLWPIVATPVHPIWVVGQQIDERAKVTAVTQPVIHLHCYRSL